MGRVDWILSGVSARGKVATAIRNGDLINLRKENVSCVDCGNRASAYEHRDYSRPLDVVPVCASCNAVRGTNAKEHEIEIDFKCPLCSSRNITANRDGLCRCRVCGEEWKK